VARVIGLTGGVASGKSTVAAMLQALGAVVLDADAIVRELQQPGTPVFRAIVEAFGPGVVRADGTLDRAALGRRVFADPEARRRLNAIVHPAVRERLHEEVDRLQRRLPPDAVIVLDIPLLLDTASRQAYPLEGVIVVVADDATQVARLRARDGLDEAEARQRLAAQRPVREKAAEADWVIDNSGSLEETRRQVEALWRRLTG
jgi:dephospho-CoA kinase